MDQRQLFTAVFIAIATGTGISLAPEVVKLIDDILFGIVQALYAIVPP